MIRALSRRAAVVFVAASCWIARDVIAEPRPLSEQAARVLFDEARSLVKSGRYDEACPKFEQSLKIDAGLGTEFNLADCWEHLGQKDKARALFLDVSEKAHVVGQADREEVARARAVALEPSAPEAAPIVAVVPPVVISGAEDDAGASPHGSKPAGVEALSLRLRTEYGSLAEAQTTLRDLTERAVLLARAAPRDPRARKLEGKIAALGRDLAGTWSLAGRVATQIARRSEHAPKMLTRSASDTKIVSAPSTAGIDPAFVARAPTGAR